MRVFSLFTKDIPASMAMSFSHNEVVTPTKNVAKRELDIKKQRLNHNFQVRANQLPIKVCLLSACFSFI